VPAGRTGKVCVGTIVGAHGVKGVVRIRSHTEDPAGVAAYGPVTDEAGARRFALTLVGQARGNVLAKLAGVDDRDAADALKGLRLYVERAALPEPAAEEWYREDLVGLRAERADGTALGTVAAVEDYGAGDIVEIRRPGAASLLVPFTREAVPVVDLAAGRIVVEPPEEIAGEEGKR
jgi:16S rRNA processing protein RimM